jgi:hypothetical protein
MSHASLNGMHRMYLDRSKPDSVPSRGTLADAAASFSPSQFWKQRFNRWPSIIPASF